MSIPDELETWEIEELDNCDFQSAQSDKSEGE
jgi:hypothetical protein